MCLFRTDIVLTDPLYEIEYEYEIEHVYEYEYTNEYSLLLLS